MTPTRQGLAGLVAATLVAVAGLVGLGAAPASADMCSTAGISAAVDFNDGAGDGIGTGCDRTTGSRSAAAVFERTGFKVRRDTQGAVCQVDSKPEKANCDKLSGTQYWALYWSNGQDGKWVYSQESDTGLTVPRNGSVAWVWQGPSGARGPGVAPAAVQQSSPTPTPRPSPAPSKATPGPADGQGAPAADAQPDRGSAPGTAGSAPRNDGSRAVSSNSTTAGDRTGGTSSGSPVGTSASADSSRAPSPRAPETPSASAIPSASPSASPSAESAPATDAAFKPASESGGLPLWMPVVVILVLASAAGTSIWWRNRSGEA